MKLKELVGDYWDGPDYAPRATFASPLPKSTKTNYNLVGDYWPGVHLFPSRTEKLSPEPPMILGSNPVK